MTAIRPIKSFTFPFPMILLSSSSSSYWNEIPLIFKNIKSINRYITQYKLYICVFVDASTRSYPFFSISQTKMHLRCSLSKFMIDLNMGGSHSILLREMMSKCHDKQQIYLIQFILFTLLFSYFHWNCIFSSFLHFWYQ